MTAFLPQHEPFFPGLFRNLRLRWDRRLYQYDDTHVSPLAILKDVPILDEFSFQWLGIVGKLVLDALANRAELEIGSQWREQHASKQQLLHEMLAVGIGSILEIKHLVTEMLQFDGRIGAAATPASSLQECADLFRAFGLPPIAKDFAEDRVFAAARTRLNW